MKKADFEGSQFEWYRERKFRLRQLSEAFFLFLKKEKNY